MSVSTTNFGPVVSLTTTLADQRPQHLFLDSNTTFTAAGTNTFSGALTASGGVTASGALTSTSTLDQDALTSVFLSKQTTASYTSLTLADGEFTVGAVSVTSAVLYFRSGVTTYRFIADAGAVI